MKTLKTFFAVFRLYLFPVYIINEVKNNFKNAFEQGQVIMFILNSKNDLILKSTSVNYDYQKLSENGMTNKFIQRFVSIS